MLKRSVVECSRSVVECSRSVVEKCCREVLWRRVVREVL